MNKRVNRILVIVFSVAFLLSSIKAISVIAADKPVAIANAVITGKSDGTEAKIVKFDDDEVETNFTFHEVGATVDYTVTINNNSDNTYTISAITDDNESESIVYEYDNHANEEFAAHSNIELAVKATYQNAVTDSSKRDELSNLKLKLNLEGEDEQSPQTFDSITIYIIIGVVSLIALIILLISHKHKKAAKTLMLLLLLPVLVRAYELNVELVIKNTIKLYDKMLVSININGETLTQNVDYNTTIANLPETEKPGYTFLGWYVGDEEFNVNTPITEDTSIEAKYEIITYDITYNYNGGSATNPEHYTVEDEITLNNPTLDGYNFAGWTGSNNDTLQTRVTINKGTTGDLNFVANFSARDDTAYTVYHRYADLNGSYEEVVENLTGVTDTQVQPQTIPRRGFVTPELQTLTITFNPTQSITYEYARETYNLTISNSEFVTTTTPSGTYPFGTHIKLTAATREGYTFHGWSDGSTEATIEFDLEEAKEIGPLYTVNNHTVTYEYFDDSENKTATLPQSTSYDFGANVTVANDLELDGYTFDGWYDGDTKVTSFEMPDRYVTLKGRLTADTVAYKIEHYTEGLDGEYTVKETENPTGKTDAPVTATPKTYEGFTYNANDSRNELSGNVAGDGSLVLKLYYTRNEHTVTYEYFADSENKTVTLPQSSTVKYGARVTIADALSLTGYTFDGWYNGDTKVTALTMPDENVTLKGRLTADTVEYKVETYKENLEGQFDKTEETKTGKTDTTATVTPETIEGFTFDENNSNNKLNGTIAGDGSLALKLYYTRNEHTVTYEYFDDSENKTVTLPQSSSVKYGASVTIANALSLTGYTFDGWYNGNSKVTTLTMLDENVTLKGRLTADTVAYKIEHYTEELTGEYVVKETENETGKTDTPVTATPKTYEGFTYNANDTRNVLNAPIAGDGSLVLKVYYTRNEHTVTYEYFADSENKTVTLPQGGTTKFGQTIIVENELSLLGYTFDGWYNGDTKVTSSFVMPDEDIVLQGRLTAETVEYTVETYKETLVDGDYARTAITLTGKTDTTATVTPEEIEGFTFDANNANNLLSGTIAGDGSLVLAVYYSRNEYTVTYDPAGGRDATLTSVSRKYEEELGELPTARKRRKILEGWFNDETTGTKFTESTQITADTTLFAHWDEDTSIICKKATELHTDTCARSDNQGCKASGYTETGAKKTSTIVFGQLPDGELKPGDAFDCDVTGDGVFDPETERFYFMRNENNDGVFIFFANYEGEDGIKIVDNYQYGEVKTKLPVLDQWWNTVYDYELDKVARIPTLQDIEEACNIIVITSGGTTALTTCDFVYENTRFIQEEHGHAGIWLESYNNKYYRIHAYSRIVAPMPTTSLNVARPTIEIPMAFVDTDYTNQEKVTITYNTMGGDNIASIQTPKNNRVLSLPTPTKQGAIFQGWYLEDTYQTLVTNSTILTQDTTFYAKWESSVNYVAHIGNDYFETLEAAINAVPKNTATPTVITLISDVQAAATIKEGRHVELDMGYYSIANNGNPAIFEITGQGSQLDIKDGTIITGSSGNAAINVKNNGKLVVTGGYIAGNGVKQAIYNDGGRVEITGYDAYVTSTSTDRATVQNHSGTMLLTAGMILSTNYIAVNNEDTLILGVEDGLSDIDSLIISGKTSGLTTTGTFEMYDGLIEAEYDNPAISDETKLIKQEENSTLTHVCENESGSQFNRVYLVMEGAKYRINLNANGGEVTPTYILVEEGEQIGTLPTPSRGAYTFDGWYDGDEFTYEITANTIPTGNMDLIAKWSFTPTDAEHDLMNAPMREYYSKIDTWKNDESTFQANMDANFEANGCLPCATNYQSCPATGEIQCDRPVGFDTGTNAEVKVYMSSPETHEKGNAVNYVTVKDGVIYNMIPGNTYYWELASDENIYGTVTVTGERRIIDAGALRNVRDLGGMMADTDGDGVGDLPLKYGILFRGVKTSSADSDLDVLRTLGIEEEIDLRGNTSGEAHLSNYQPRQIINYEIDPTNFAANYAQIRAVVAQTMQDVIDGKTIYYHCAIGTDRTGTLSYILEGLLGVTEEERLQDYELSYFYGLLNRHRFYSEQPGSSITHRFVYMHENMATNAEILEWYLYGSTNEEADKALIERFKEVMIQGYTDNL